MKNTTHTRMYEETLRKLRHIHAETNERMLDILERLISTEWNKLQNKEGKNHENGNLCNH